MEQQEQLNITINMWVVTYPWANRGEHNNIIIIIEVSYIYNTPAMKAIIHVAVLVTRDKGYDEK